MQLSRESLLKAYRAMRTIREFEDRLHIEIAKGKIPGFTHLYSGQEACAVGVCENLTDHDYIVSTHRGHGHCIAKGCDVKGMMQEIHAKAGGLCGGKGGSMHIADISKGMLGANGIVGGGPPLAVGAAIANRNKGKGGVAVSFGGDGSSNQGTTFEAMNMAVVLKVPAIFVIENNGYGEHTGADYAVGSHDIAGRAAAFGMPAVKVNGLDFFEVYEAMREVVERARKGGGPSLLELQTVRFFGHFEGDPQKYRADGEVDEARKNSDCLKVFRSRVSDAKLLDSKDLDAIDAEVLALIDAAVDEAHAAPVPAPEQLLSNVYNAY